MSTNELKAAAERLKRHRIACEAGKEEDSPYAIPYITGNAGLRGGWMDTRKLENDTQVVAFGSLDLVLAEHSADEDEPITGEWMKSLDAKPNYWMSGTCDWDLPCDDFCVEVRIWNDPSINIDVILSNSGRHHGNCQFQMKTRGQFSALCKALGITLKDPGATT